MIIHHALLDGIFWEAAYILLSEMGETRAHFKGKETLAGVGWMLYLCGYLTGCVGDPRMITEPCSSVSLSALSEELYSGARPVRRIVLQNRVTQCD